MKSKSKILIFTSFLSLGLLLSIYATSAETITKTLYSWVKDAAGNISLPLSDTVDITLPDEPANTYYVSYSEGLDTNNGTSSSTPWKTIAKVNSQTFTPGASILFKKGDTWTGETITVNSSGNATNPITYSSYGTGEKPVISGFTTITGWTSEGGGIYSKVIASQSQTNMVTIDDVQYGMGRTPNNGTYYYIDSTTGGQDITDSDLNSSVINWVGAQVVVRTSLMLKWTVGNIVTHSGNTITYVQQPSDTDATNPNGVDCAYFIQNDLRTLDQYGEWYHDFSTGKFYMYFGGVNPTSHMVKVSVIDILFNIVDRDYININNLSFKGSNTKSIYYRTSDWFKCQSCDFDFSGNWGIHGSASTDSLIENNIFNHSNDSSMLIASYSHRATIRGNKSYNTGLVIGAGRSIWFSAQGMIIFQNNDSLIEYNEVYNAGSTGIRFGGTNTIVRYNYVNVFSMHRADCGGLAYGDQAAYTNMNVYNNIVLNGLGGINGIPTGQTAHGTFGIYFDYYSSGNTITNNTVANIKGGGIILNGNNNMNVTGNKVFNSTIAFYPQEIIGLPAPLRNITLTGNIFMALTNTQKAMWAISNTNDFNQWGTLDYNYYARPIDDNLTISTSAGNWTENPKTLAQWQTLSSQDLNSHTSPVTITDPNDILFEYNATTSNKTVSLGSNTYVDITGTTKTGSITLLPYTSIILIKTN